MIPTWLCGSFCPSVCLMLSSSLSFSFSRRHIARSANSRLAHRHRLPPSPSIDGRLSFETEVERERMRGRNSIPQMKLDFRPFTRGRFSASFLVSVSFPPLLHPSPSHSPPVLIPVHDLVLAKPKIMRASNFMCFVLNGTEVSISRHFV